MFKCNTVHKLDRPFQRVDRFILLTRTPGVTQQDEFAKSVDLLATSEHAQLQSVGAHRCSGRRADEYGGLVGVQVLWVEIGSPLGGGSFLRYCDWHRHIQAA